MPAGDGPERHHVRMRAAVALPRATETNAAVSAAKTNAAVSAAKSSPEAARRRAVKVALPGCRPDRIRS